MTKKRCQHNLIASCPPELLTRFDAALEKAASRLPPELKGIKLTRSSVMRSIVERWVESVEKADDSD